jgi:hypothetical protein
VIVRQIQYCSWILERLAMSAQPEVALITGCGSGIGKALAKDLHNRRTETGSPKFIVYATDYRYPPHPVLSPPTVAV